MLLLMCCGGKWLFGFAIPANKSLNFNLLISGSLNVFALLVLLGQSRASLLFVHSLNFANDLCIVVIFQLIFSENLCELILCFYTLFRIH